MDKQTATRPNPRKPMDVMCVDVTLRDGGYVNKWAFSREFIRRHLEVCSVAGIDFCEVGFANNKLGEVHTPFLRKLEPEDIEWMRCAVPNCTKLAVMCEVGKFDAEAFPDPSVFQVDLVRVSVDVKDIRVAALETKTLVEKGYTVSLNITHCSLLDLEQLNGIVQTIQTLVAERAKPSIVCFADTFGSMYPHEVSKIFEIFGDLNVDLGFHTHNNLQLALANALQALKLGVRYIDASMNGLGRGGGNLQMENFLQYLCKQGKEVDIPLVLDYLELFMEDLRAWEWGWSLPMMIAGELNMHPYWVDNLLSTKFGSLSSLRRALQAIPMEEKRNFQQIEDRHVLNFLNQSWIDFNPKNCLPITLRYESGPVFCVVVGKGPQLDLAVPACEELLFLIANEATVPKMFHRRNCRAVRVFTSAIRAERWLKMQSPMQNETILCPRSPLLHNRGNLVQPLPVYHTDMLELCTASEGLLGLPVCSTGAVCCALAAWLGSQTIFCSGLLGFDQNTLVGAALFKRDVEVLQKVVCTFNVALPEMFVHAGDI